MRETDNIMVPDNNELSLKDVISKLSFLLKYLKSKWKTVVIVSLFGAILGISYSMLKRPIYVADLSFALEENKPGGGLGAYSGIASQFGLDLGGGGGAFSGDNLVELMKSRLMVQKALLTKLDGKNQTLADLYIDFNNLRSKWKDKTELANITFSPGSNPKLFSLKQDSILYDFYKKMLQTNLSVDKVDKKLSIIKVRVVSENELFSKSFAEALVNDVSTFYIETKTKKFNQNVNILQNQTDSVRRQLNNAISGVAASVDVNPNANPYRQILKAPTQHRQIDIQVNTAILSELVKNLEIAKVSLRNETPLIQLIDTPIMPLEVDKVGKIKGGLIGAIAGFFLSILALLIKRVYKAMLR